MQIQELILKTTAKETFEDDDGLKVFKGQFFGEQVTVSNKPRSNSSRFPLCVQHSTTKFIYLPLVIDLIQTTENSEFPILSP